MLNNDVKTYLENLDREQKLSRLIIASMILLRNKNILAKDTNYKPTIEDIAEQMAFDFMTHTQTIIPTGKLITARCLFCQTSKDKWLSIRVLKE